MRMNLAVPGSPSKRVEGRQSPLAYFVLGSLLLHVVVAGLWHGEPPAGPTGDGVFHVTLLARHGHAADTAAAAPPQLQADNASGPDGNHPASGKPSPAAMVETRAVRSRSTLAALAKAASQEAEYSQQPANPPRPDTKTSSARVSEQDHREANAGDVFAQVQVSATPGSASHGQHELSSAARHHRVMAELHRALLPYFEYPTVARRRGWQGRATVGLHVEADGDLTRVHLVESSGYALLDRAAVKNVTELRTVPGAARWLEGSNMDVVLPVRYQLQDR